MFFLFFFVFSFVSQVPLLVLAPATRDISPTSYKHHTEKNKEETRKMIPPVRTLVVDLHPPFRRPLRAINTHYTWASTRESTTPVADAEESFQNSSSCTTHTKPGAAWYFQSMKKEKKEQKTPRDAPVSPINPFPGYYVNKSTQSLPRQ